MLQQTRPLLPMGISADGRPKWTRFGVPRLLLAPCLCFFLLCVETSCYHVSSGNSHTAAQLWPNTASSRHAGGAEQIDRNTSIGHKLNKGDSRDEAKGRALLQVQATTAGAEDKQVNDAAATSTTPAPQQEESAEENHDTNTAPASHQETVSSSGPSATGETPDTGANSPGATDGIAEGEAAANGDQQPSDKSQEESEGDIEAVKGVNGGSENVGGGTSDDVASTTSGGTLEDEPAVEGIKNGLDEPQKGTKGAPESTTKADDEAADVGPLASDVDSSGDTNGKLSRSSPTRRGFRHKRRPGQSGKEVGSDINAEAGIDGDTEDSDATGEKKLGSRRVRRRLRKRRMSLKRSWRTLRGRVRRDAEAAVQARVDDDAEESAASRKKKRGLGWRRRVGNRRAVRKRRRESKRGAVGGETDVAGGSSSDQRETRRRRVRITQNKIFLGRLGEINRSRRGGYRARRFRGTGGQEREPIKEAQVEEPLSPYVSVPQGYRLTEQTGETVLAEEGDQQKLGQTMVSLPTSFAKAPASTVQGSEPGSVGAATCLVDMTKFGNEGGFNPLAFIFQEACQGFHPSVLFRKYLPRPYEGGCVVKALLSIAEDHTNEISKHRNEKGSPGPTPTRRKLADFLKTMGRGFTFKKIRRAVRRALKSQFRESRETEDIEKVVADITRRERSFSGVLPHIMRSFLMCQPTLSEEAAVTGKFQVGDISQAANPAVTYLKANGAFMRMPLDAPVGAFSLDPRLSPQGGNGWQKELLKTLASALQLMDIMIGLGERVDAYAQLDPANVFPRPWVVDALVVPSYSEYVPVHTSDFEISPIAAPILQKYGVNVGDKVVRRGRHRKTIPNWIYEGPYSSLDAASPGTLPPVNADRCFRTSTVQAPVASPFAAILMRDQKLRAPKIDIPSTDVDCLFLLRGPKYSKEWTALFMNGPRTDTFLAQAGEGLVHEGLNAFFHNVLRGPATNFLERLKTTILPAYRGLVPFTILIVGHSTGGALASFLAWFLSKHLTEEIKRRKVKIRCAGFGSPPMADEQAFKRMKKDGVSCWTLYSDLDTLFSKIDAVGGAHLTTGPIIKLPVGQLFRAEVPAPQGPPLYLGLSWALRHSIEDAEHEVSISDISWNNAITRAPLVIHDSVYYCMITLLAGKFKDFGWGSRCAAPFIRGLFPHSSIANLYEALKDAHTDVMPDITKQLEQVMLFQRAAYDDKLKTLDMAAETNESAARS
ncbi:lipase [Toxoplasma gondii ARI]|uniref:Lipase n=1 Tax=Toxoplasma gondii ARI TaxID=1074872 RepID=A0A139XT54_TOXGO|nr:lipase [Toxoplasma gondii ARI]